MKKREREEFIMDKLYARKKLEISEAIELIGASESTVRRIFNDLERTGKAIRTHGGITLVSGPSEYSFESLIHENFKQKQLIGITACNEINDNDTIYLDCGTTVLALCIELAKQIQAGEKRNLQIFTNSLANMDVLSPVTAVNLIGGRYRPNRKDFAGYLSEKMLKEIHFFKCFLGADGVSAASGFTATDLDTASLNQIVIANSNLKYIVCDVSKFNKNSLVSYAPVLCVNTLITNSGADADLLSEMRRQGLRIIEVAYAH